MNTVEREDVGAATRQVLSVTLMNGDELEADFGEDADAARAELASVHKRLGSESFVRLGEYTIVGARTSVACSCTRRTTRSTG